MYKISYIIGKILASHEDEKMAGDHDDNEEDDPDVGDGSKDGDDEDDGNDQDELVLMRGMP